MVKGCQRQHCHRVPTSALSSLTAMSNHPRTGLTSDVMSYTQSSSSSRDEFSMSALIPLSDLAEHFSCAICLNDTMHRCHMIKQCGHQFCEDCIRECLDRKHQCPLCLCSASIHDLVHNRAFDRLIEKVKQSKDGSIRRINDKLMHGAMENQHEHQHQPLTAITDIALSPTHQPPVSASSHEYDPIESSCHQALQTNIFQPVHAAYLQLKQQQQQGAPQPAVPISSSHCTETDPAIRTIRNLISLYDEYLRALPPPPFLQPIEVEVHFDMTRDAMAKPLLMSPPMRHLFSSPSVTVAASAITDSKPSDAGPNSSHAILFNHPCILSLHAWDDLSTLFEALMTELSSRSKSSSQPQPQSMMQGSNNKHHQHHDQIAFHELDEASMLDIGIWLVGVETKNDNVSVSNGVHNGPASVSTSASAIPSVHTSSPSFSPSSPHNLPRLLNSSRDSFTTALHSLGVHHDRLTIMLQGAGLLRLHPAVLAEQNDQVRDAEDAVRQPVAADSEGSASASPMSPSFPSVVVPTAPGRCFATEPFDPKNEVRIDYFKCQQCKLNWLCKSCAEHCHVGHAIQPFMSGHKPSYAACYCKKKRCVLMEQQKQKNK